MIDKLKLLYRNLPLSLRCKISKVIWYLKRPKSACYFLLRKVSFIHEFFLSKIRLIYNSILMIFNSILRRTKENTLLEIKVNQISINGDLSCLNSLEGTNGYSFLLFPVIDWNFRIQRPQHLSREIAHIGSNVIYFTTTFQYSLKPGFKLESSPSKNVVICKLNLNVMNVNIYNNTLKTNEISFLLKSINSVRMAFNLKHTFSIINLPFWNDVSKRLVQNSIIYDCMDHHAGFENNSDLMLKNEEDLLKHADLVITTAKTLSDRISETRDNTIIRNAAEVKYFSDYKPDCENKPSNGITVGYYGAVAEWFDLDLIIYVAKNAPDLEIVIIGNVTIDVSDADDIENIKFIGEIPYKNLAEHLYSFDVCIIPFKIIELTICTNPVKVYEYLAAGKPVVSTAMPEIKLISEYVHVGRNKKEFLENVRLALTEKDDLSLAKKRKDWALQHDWSTRAKELLSAIEQIEFNKKKVSLIVLTYNNLDLTKKCLNSILNNTVYDNYEVILVDNNSTDGTQDYLKNTYANNGKFKIILNEENVGFAAGNNIGLAEATGDILVILNNDTYVSKYWLEPIVSILISEDVGLVCPVTNNIGNEAKINIQYDNFNEMNIQALIYTSKNAGKTHPMNSVAFFCAAMRKDVFDEIGPLSEEYGLGYFEDDDYSLRVLNAGYKNYAIEGSFVHHHLSASFNKLGEEKKQKLMEKNRAIFEKNWGEWKPHRYRKGVH